ncbi:MAG TPA: LysM peptidoglycan-binding domain-containing protein [Treponema sp.]|nr:LysM peptidoglycan-binding domain-containing protein [Treponema sp.]
MKWPTIKRMDTKNSMRLSAILCFFLFLLPSMFSKDMIHILKKGETLYGVSRKYKVSADAIMQYNNISNPDKLQVGHKLRIPSVYTVQKGDTLYGIARSFSVPVDELLASNKLNRETTIRIGDVLHIPAIETKTETTVTVSNLPVVVPASPIVDPRMYKTRKIDSTVIWPVDGREIAYLSGKLYGVSITSDKNSEVKTVSSGIVLSTGPYRGFGQVVFIQSKNGYIYVYGGLSRMNVRPGDALSFGDALGVVGADSLSGKPQLYFMVYNKDKPIDPAKAPRG